MSSSNTHASPLTTPASPGPGTQPCCAEDCNQSPLSDLDYLPTQSTTIGTCTPDSPSPSQAVKEWGARLLSQGKTEFTEYVAGLAAKDLTPHLDIDGMHYINPQNLQHFCFGEWQSITELDPCIRSITRLYNISTDGILMSNNDIPELRAGRPPPSWSTDPTFLNQTTPGPLHIPRCMGIMHHRSHFTVIYICPQYWTILDPLYPLRSPPPHTPTKHIHAAISEFYNIKGLPTPPLPPFRSITRIAIQNDVPQSPWSCGTYAALTVLHFLLGAPHPHTIPPESITKMMAYNFHETLQSWHLTGSTPDPHSA